MKLSKIILSSLLIILVSLNLLKLPTANVVKAEDEITIETILPTDSRLVYSGNWEYPTVASTCTSGNSVTYNGVFTRVDYYGEASENMTSYKITLDGVDIINSWPIRDISQRNTSEFLYTTGVLERKEHTLTITHTGSTGWISLDKLVVYDDTYDFVIKKVDNTEDNENVNFSYFGVGEGYYKQTVSSSCTRDAYIVYEGNNVRNFVIWGDKSYNRGYFDVYIDDIYDTTINLYDGLYNANGSYPVYVSDFLPKGNHTIKIVCLNRMDIMATETWVAIDAIDMILYEEDNESDSDSGLVYDDDCFGYHGEWHTYSNLGGLYYKETAHSTNTKDSYFTCSFKDATMIEVYGTKAANRALADVYIDNVFHSQIDTYSPNQTKSEVIFKIDNLAPGIHNIKIINTGNSTGSDTWLEIDKVKVEGINTEEMVIQATNNSFIQKSNNAKLDKNDNYVLEEKDYITISIKSKLAQLYSAEESEGKVSIYLDEKLYKTNVEVTGSGLMQELNNLDNSIFHTIKIVCDEGTVIFSHLIIDDKTMSSIDSYMRTLALQEIEDRKNNKFATSNPNTWTPINYSATSLNGGVTLNGGLLGEMSDKNEKYLQQSVLQQNGVDNFDNFWIGILGGSNEGRLLQGYANSLLWNGENANYEEQIDKILKNIRARQVQQNGYALPYEEVAMGGYNDAAYDERRNYDRAMFTRGLVAAGNYYDSKGIAVKDNLAYIILRDFYDWFNYNENGYGQKMLEGFLGIQGHIGSTLTYFTPVGKTDDLSFAELCYVSPWWMEFISNNKTEAIYKFPLNRPHCYITTAMEAYLDHYRATGDQQYLDTCLSYWEIMNKNFIHTGGSFAICEHQMYEPGSYYLEDKNHTGELCGSVFWIEFNYRLLQLFPNEEKYANEIERSIYNVLAAAQDDNGKIRYHQNLNGMLLGAGKINTCCEVTSIGVLSKIQSYLYQVTDSGLNISMYNSSKVQYNENGKNYLLEIIGDASKDNSITIINDGSSLELNLRIPSWSTLTTITKNGEKLEDVRGGQYYKLNSKHGDIIRLQFNREVKAVKYEGYSNDEKYDRYCFMYGNTLMAISPITNKYETRTINKESVLYIADSIENFYASINLEAQTAYNGNYMFVPYHEIEKEYFSSYPVFKTDKSEELYKLKGEIVWLDKASDKDNFSLYKVEGTNPVVENTSIISNSNKEQKVIFNDKHLKDSTGIAFIASGSVSGGRIDGGIYIGVGNDVANKIDAIDGYNINVERAANSNYYDIKIHSFSYNGGNGKYNGCIASSRFVVESDEILVTIYYKNGILYVYNNGSNTPCIQIELEISETDKLGVRFFNTPMIIKDIQLFTLIPETTNPDNPGGDTSETPSEEPSNEPIDEPSENPNEEPQEPTKKGCRGNFDGLLGLSLIAGLMILKRKK